MLVNNKSVRGMYIFDSSLSFERGDFVIYNNSIYVCKPIDRSVVTGEIPSESESFVPYPGDFASVQDYEDYIKNSQSSNLGQNKYVSSSSLFEILQSSFFGVNSYGIITARIGDGNYKSLDSLMTSETLNNGLVKVLREEVVEAGLPELYTEDETGKYVIVRQSTYINGESPESTVMRVQELLDPYSGILVCRSHKLGDSYISPWKSCIESDELLAAKFHHLKNYYLMRDRLNHETNEFYFKKADWEADPDGQAKYIVDLTSIPDNGKFVTASFISEERRVQSASFGLLIDDFFKISDDLTVRVENISQDQSNIYLESGSYYRYQITDMYCRNYGSGS